MKYKIKLKKSIYKDLRKIPHQDQIKISKVIKKLSNNPRPEKVKALSGTRYFRIRCGEYRVVYDIQDDVLIVLVIKVGHRKGVYRKM